ncbi:MAG TPA: potassium channel family protein [Pyrinomonadaceae bacterium]|nr:potassium channel family protein [Pyrinomonadaceae bacterium]
MQIIAAVFGTIIIVIILWDAFEAIVLPRRVTRRLRLTSAFFRTTWYPVWALAWRTPPSKRRDRYLGFYGPLSLLMLLLVWAVGLILGFALLQWAFEAELQMPGEHERFGTYLYMSGVIFFTLGFGDVVPLEPLGRVIAVIEAGTGFGFLAIVIGYLPVIYQSFSRREVNISMLDARAGSPPTALELLRRHSESGSIGKLEELLREWEHWSADLLESHLSYPVLCYYRSQHDNQSWLASLTSILDACALVMVGVDGVRAWQAQLTFAMARHAVVDITQILNVRPAAPDKDRLPVEDLARLRGALARAGITLSDGDGSNDKLEELRQMYEPYVNALACRLLITLPPWIPAKDRSDNWQTSAWERAAKGLHIAPTPKITETEHF